MIKYWWLSALAFLLNPLLFISIPFPVCLWWANPQQCCPWKLPSVADVGHHSQVHPCRVHPACRSPVHQEAWGGLIAAFIHTGCLDPAVWIKLQHEACWRGEGSWPRGQGSRASFFSHSTINFPVWAVHPKGACGEQTWGSLLPLRSYLCVCQRALQTGQFPTLAVLWGDSNGSVTVRGGGNLALSWLRKEQVDEGVESARRITRWWNQYQEVLWNFPQEGFAAEM